MLEVLGSATELKCEIFYPRTQWKSDSHFLVVKFTLLAPIFRPPPTWRRPRLGQGEVKWPSSEGRDEFANYVSAGRVDDGGG